MSRSNDVHEAQDAEYFNFNPVEVPEPLYELLKMSQHCPDVVELWAKAEEQVYNLPDWVAPNAKAKETAERFRSLGITWFKKALKNTRLVYKCFPPGNQRLVVPGKNQQNERIYAIDMVLLDSPEATHKWVQKQSCSSGKRCIDPKQNETRCGGGCTMLYYSEALKICLKKVVGYSMDLDAMQKIAMMRHQVSDLDAVQILPDPVCSSANRSNHSPNTAYASNSSPANLSSQGVSHTSSNQPIQHSPGFNKPNTVVGNVPEQKRGVALGESQSNSTLLQACFNGTVQQANDPYLSAIRHNGAPASFQFERSHCSGQSAINLIPLAFPNSVLPLYHEGENVDMAVSLGCNQERARFMSEFAIFIADLARSVFNISDLASCMRVFWEDADRIAFNYGGKLFFNARYAHVQLQTRNPSRYIESYWYVTFCHELAHNVASGHNKDHEFAEEILLVTFMGGLQDFISKRLVKQ